MMSADFFKLPLRADKQRTKLVVAYPAMGSLAPQRKPSYSERVPEPIFFLRGSTCLHTRPRHQQQSSLE